MGPHVVGLEPRSRSGSSRVARSLWLGWFGVLVLVALAGTSHATAPAECCGTPSEFCDINADRATAIVEFRPRSYTWPDPMQTKPHDPCLLSSSAEFVPVGIPAQLLPSPALAPEEIGVISTQDFEPLVFALAALKQPRFRNLDSCRIMAFYSTMGSYRWLRLIGVVDAGGRLHSFRDESCPQSIGDPVFDDVAMALLLDKKTCYSVLDASPSSCTSFDESPGCAVMGRQTHERIARGGTSMILLLSACFCVLMTARRTRS